ncbi:MAG: hypothetical protein LBP60_05100 [Spirochaetaceae bacterium]|jgi:hypothetical protein|nr:hypothetical protein [Spirochaetaceae bacterium]
MKNYILIFLTALGPVCSVMGELPEFTLSAGGGFLLGGLFTRYTLTADENTPLGPADLEMTQAMDQFNYGGYLFIDATYGEFTVEIQRGLNRYQETLNGIGQGSYFNDIPLDGTGTETMLGFTLAGKYPFTLREGLSIYPLVGIEYQIALVEKRRPEGEDTQNRADGKTELDGSREFSRSMWNSLFIDAGAGLDLMIKYPFFLRAELVYRFRLKTPAERESIDYVQDRFGISRPTLFGNPRISGLTHGPELRVALGCRFF